jgi:hypothetical protein
MTLSFRTKIVEFKYISLNLIVGSILSDADRAHSILLCNFLAIGSLVNADSRSSDRLFHICIGIMRPARVLRFGPMHSLWMVPVPVPWLEPRSELRFSQLWSSHCVRQILVSRHYIVNNGKQTMCINR